MTALAFTLDRSNPEVLRYVVDEPAPPTDPQERTEWQDRWKDEIVGAIGEVHDAITYEDQKDALGKLVGVSLGRYPGIETVGCFESPLATMNGARLWLSSHGSELHLSRADVDQAVMQYGVGSNFAILSTKMWTSVNPGFQEVIERGDQPLTQIGESFGQTILARAIPCISALLPTLDIREKLEANSQKTKTLEARLERRKRIKEAHRAFMART